MPSDRTNSSVLELARKNRASRGISRSGNHPVFPINFDAVRRGDEEALRYAIKEYSPLVYGVALRITRSEADAEDVLQEIFIGLPEALHHFDGRRFVSWLTVVTKRRALMLLRSERRRDEYTRAAGRSKRTCTEDQTLNKIMIDNALERLHPTLRAVFVLKEMEGLSHKEIAEAMGTTENLSQVRLHRARRALQSLLR